MRPTFSLICEALPAIAWKPSNRVMINGQAAVTPDTALPLARALRTTPEFWLNLQMRFDLDTAVDAGDDG